MGIRCKAVLSNLTIGQEAAYRLVPQDATKVDEATFVTAVALKANMTEAQSRFWLDAFREVLVEQLAKNSSIDLGFLGAKLAVTGSLQAVNEQPNKVDNTVVARIHAKGALAEAVAALGAYNDSMVVPSVLNEVQQDNVADPCKIVNTTDRIVANGNLIKISANKSDEGIWLTNIDTGVVVATATISYTDSSVAYFKFTTLPETGRYRLILATRNGMDESYAVNKLSRYVYVVND